MPDVELSTLGATIKTAYEGQSDTNAFTDAASTKLAGVEAGATADQSAAEIKAAYESNSDTNGLTDAQVTKLSQAPISDPSAVTGADQITNMMSLTQAEYDAITTPDAATLYVITDA